MMDFTLPQAISEGFSIGEFSNFSAKIYQLDMKKTLW